MPEPLTLFLGILAILIAVAGVFHQVNQLAVRSARLERKVDQVLGHFGLAQPAKELSERVRSLAVEGKKIEAIKALREETGLGLADAKAAVEAGMGTRETSSP